MPASAERAIGHYHTFNLFSFVGTLVFIVTLIATGGMFGYTLMIEGRVEEKGNQLKDVKSTLDVARVQDFKQLDERLALADSLLAEHTALTKFFDALEAATLHSVQFNSFNYKTDPTSGTLLVTLSGEAESYNALSLQADVFERESLILTQAYSNISLSKLGTVLFSVEIGMNANGILYSTPS